MAVDPFAAAQVAGSAGTSAPVGSTAVAEDPFVSSHDMEDPFATSSDFKGGDFTPSPPIELLRGRLLVMIPRDFEKEQDDPFNPGKKRELYTVDLTVLDGGPLKFQYKIKADAEKGTPERYEEFDAGDPSAENPFTLTRFWVPQGGIIGKLKQTHRRGSPLLGVLDFIPQKAGRDKGQTAAQIRKEYDAWVGRNKVGTGPLTAWAMDDPSPERRSIAIKWWAANKADIAAINTSTAPAS